MDYKKTCGKCVEVVCCSAPFYAFMTKSERDRILKYLKKHKIQDNLSSTVKIFEKIQPSDSGNYLITKKKDGKCIFLSKDNLCIIHEVKPLDCQMWPLTYEYNEDSGNLSLLIGDCLISRELMKNNQLDDWIKEQVEILMKSFEHYKESDLIDYSKLPNVPILEQCKLHNLSENFKKHKIFKPIL